MKKYNLIAIWATLSLLGCARYEVAPLDPNTGKINTEKAKGIKYYLPKPYLIVAEVPIENSTNLDADKPFDTDATKNAASAPRNATGAGKDGNATSKSNNDPSSSTSPSSASDTSFGMSTKQYSIKLIYLPDKTQPMTIYQPWYWMFGTASITPTLQDGWMLTSLTESTDSKTAETLTALASLAGAAASGGSSAVGSAAVKKVTKSSQDLEELVKSYSPGFILTPGLYSFETDTQTGKALGFIPIEFFCKGKIVPVTATKGKNGKLSFDPNDNPCP